MRCSRLGRLHAGGLFLLLVSISGSLAAATYTVTNTNDSGSGSLRQAILSANANAGKDSIHFQIPGAGVRSIAPASALPVVTDPLIIRGHTQPGFSGRPLIELNGAGAGAGANGLQISAGDSEVYALAINRFQAIFLGGGGNGIVLEGGGSNIVSGCFLGTSASGTAARGNLGAGILISSSPQNQVGPPPVSPPSPLTANVFSGNSTGVLIVGNGSDANNVSGNTVGMDLSAQIDLGNSGDGIAVTAGTGNVIQVNLVTGNDGNGILISAAATETNVRANFVGTSFLPETRGNGADGIEITGASGNVVTENEVVGNGANGILLFTGAANNTISGNVVGTSRAWVEGLGNAFNGIIAAEANDNTIVGNLVVGNGTNGIRLRSGASGNVVVGNRVGISFGPAHIPNGDDGIEVNDGAVNNRIGGTESGHVNLVSGNTANGIRITDATTTGNLVQGNRFGTTGTSIAPQGNLGHGVLIEKGSNGNTVGGTASGAGNRIAFNGGDGIFISSGSGNGLLGNGIEENAGLGIDLAPDGATGNDPGDGDAGPNQLQNTPVLTSGSSTGGDTSIQGTLASVPSTLFRLEFFASAACDPSGAGEGAAFLGSADITTDGGGNGPLPRHSSRSVAAALPHGHRDGPLRKHIGILPLRDGPRADGREHRPDLRAGRGRHLRDGDRLELPERRRSHVRRFGRDRGERQLADGSDRGDPRSCAGDSVRRRRDQPQRALRNTAEGMARRFRGRAGGAHLPLLHRDDLPRRDHGGLHPGELLPCGLGDTRPGRRLPASQPRGRRLRASARDRDRLRGHFRGAPLPPPGSRSLRRRA